MNLDSFDLEETTDKFEETLLLGEEASNILLIPNKRLNSFNVMFTSILDLVHVNFGAGGRIVDCGPEAYVFLDFLTCMIMSTLLCLPLMLCCIIYPPSSKSSKSFKSHRPA